ncbi:MAG: hypothetical protein ACK55I_04890, partial [bacterium]
VAAPIEAEVAQHLVPARLFVVRRGCLLGGERMGQQPLAQLHRLGELHRLEEMADLGAGPGGGDEVEPRRVRARLHGGDDLGELRRDIPDLTDAGPHLFGELVHLHHTCRDAVLH